MTNWKIQSSLTSAAGIDEVDNIAGTGGSEQPDGTKKILNIGTENQNLVVEQGKITVYSDVVFTPQDNN